MQKVINVVVPSLMPAAIMLGTVCLINHLHGDNVLGKGLNYLLFAPIFVRSGNFIADKVEQEFNN